MFRKVSIIGLGIVSGLLGLCGCVIEPFSGPDSSVLLYFVAKQDGSWTHYFSKTYAEHQIAVDYYLKGKKQKKPSGTTQPF